ncbi:DUF2306 domain-containing protein [Maribacter sp. 2-571]|uniref:DUF2306 domain-containing protein n=1 Tax=Maribacter sp. 2-571 TaxID=3417569 RepID=UPI003D35388F
MEPIAKILIYIHAATGGLALLAGLISLIATKGFTLHRRSGLVFYFSMLVSALTALVVATIPNHQSPFLFAVGVFSLYFILTGKRALRFKKKKYDLHWDKRISWMMIVTGILMVILPMLVSKTLNIVLCVFAGLGIVFSVRDLLLFKNRDKLQKVWLKLHLGKMMGAYISATTAFVVVNELLPGLYAWFLPGLAGGVLIVFWIRKLNR